MKQITIAILLLLALSIHAQIQPKAAFEYFPNKYCITIQQPIVNVNECNAVSMRYGLFRVKIGCDYMIGKTTIYFDQHIYMNKSASYMFQPMQAYWYTGIVYAFTSKLKIKAEHLCVHPIKTSGKEESTLLGGYDMLSISWGY